MAVDFSPTRIVGIVLTAVSLTLTVVAFIMSVVAFSRNNSSNGQISSLDNRITALKGNISNQRTTLRNQGDMIRNLNTKTEDIKAKSNTSVAFSVRLDDSMDSQNMNKPIPYNVVITNIGNAYNVARKRFFAPVGGIYAFQWNVLGGNGLERDHRDPCCYLEADNDFKMAASAGGDNHKAAGNMVVLQLRRGAGVSIRLTESGCGVHYDPRTPTNRDKVNSFSGFLITQTD